ncbi:hypothetical protein SAMN05444955_101328 [Lihuaxuella thermophila]|uniref:Uncharacterized protein n=1 Tax=Lihuaxuella thermophila TaxID=1173111 RepID=A0A1H8AUR3_9BACL|nr:hypothetical protein SAMN05444955_101328 [Lihuaxuella thermophila]
MEGLRIWLLLLPNRFLPAIHTESKANLSDHDALKQTKPGDHLRIARFFHRIEYYSIIWTNFLERNSRMKPNRIAMKPIRPNTSKYPNDSVNAAI